MLGITSNAEKVGAAILHERDGGGSQEVYNFMSVVMETLFLRQCVSANQNVQFTPEGSTSNPYFSIDSTGDNIRLRSKIIW